MNVNSTADLASIKQYDVGNLIETSRTLGLPFALWRKPGEETLFFLVSFTPNLVKGYSKIEEMPSGFIVSSFSSESVEEAAMILGDLIFELTTSGQILSCNENASVDHYAHVASFLENLRANRKKSFERKYNNHLLPLSKENEMARYHYTSIVQEAIEAIGEGQFDKVVLSRTKQFRIQDTFDVGHAFLKLEKAYAAAFVSLIYIPEQDEMWLGASPEILVEVLDQKVFKTIALAGTQSALDEHGQVFSCEEAKWGHKEIEEQALVSRYIVSCFKKIRLREYTENGPRSVLAGNLYHLKSEFEVDMVTCCFPDLGTVMLSLLHPTSAVCGMPKEPSKAFIVRSEGYDRSYYSGFIGPVNVQSASNIYVNLRTVRLKDDCATFFAGAGITAGSNPDKEWIETELKCDTLLRIINQPAL